MGTHADSGEFIIGHLVEVAKTTYENVISVRGTITAIAQTLGHNWSLAPTSLTFGVEGEAITNTPTTNKFYSLSPMWPEPPSPTKEI